MNERQVAIAVGATAAAMSPKARDAVRTGAVYGLAGVLKAGDVLVGSVRGAARGAQQGFTAHNGASSATESRSASPSGQSGRRTSSGRRQRAAT